MQLPVAHEEPAGAIGRDTGGIQELARRGAVGAEIGQMVEPYSRGEGRARRARGRAAGDLDPEELDAVVVCVDDRQELLGVDGSAGHHGEGEGAAEAAIRSPCEPGRHRMTIAPADTLLPRQPVRDDPVVARIRHEEVPELVDREAGRRAERPADRFGERPVRVEAADQVAVDQEDEAVQIHRNRPHLLEAAPAERSDRGAGRIDPGPGRRGCTEKGAGSGRRLIAVRVLLSLTRPHDLTGAAIEAGAGHHVVGIEPVDPEEVIVIGKVDAGRVLRERERVPESRSVEVRVADEEVGLEADEDLQRASRGGVIGDAGQPAAHVVARLPLPG